MPIKGICTFVSDSVRMKTTHVIFFRTLNQVPCLGTFALLFQAAIHLQSLCLIYPVKHFR